MTLTTQPSPSEQTLEATVARLVAEALRACGQDLVTCVRAVDAGKQSSTPEIAVQEAVPGLLLEQQVISLRTLEELRTTEKLIRILPGAVLTPAAKDFLRHHGINVVRATDVHRNSEKPRAAARHSQPNMHPEFCTIIVDTGLPDRSEAVARQLSLRGLSVSPGKMTDVVERRGIGSGVAVIISSLPVIEVDFLSRVHSVRTAIADSVDAVERISGRFEPNAWILDAHRLTLSGLVSIAERCIRSHKPASVPEKVSLPAMGRVSR